MTTLVYLLARVYNGLVDTALFEANMAVALGDPTNQTFSASTIQTIMVLAVRAYRRWRECLRPYGSGVIYSTAASGQNVVQVCGGPFIVGSPAIIDFGSYQETFTITAIGAGTQLSNWMGTPQALTLSGNLAYTHAAGARVSMQTPALVIVPGTNQYALPTDFVRLDTRTFNLANGSQTQVKQVERFYDGVYYYSGLLSGVGWGQSQNFVALSGPGTQGFLAVPDGANTFNPPVAGSTQIAFDVLPGNPPLLLMTPVPMFNATWQFSYFAAHQPETVPDEDFDAVLDAGYAIAMEIRVGTNSASFNFREADVAEMPDVLIKQLVAAGKNALDRFDTKIRKRPFMVTG